MLHWIRDADCCFQAMVYSTSISSERSTTSDHSTAKTVYSLEFTASICSLNYHPLLRDRPG